MSSGSFGCWAQKAGDFRAKEFEGTQAGLDAAVAYCGSNGMVSAFPGAGGVTVGTVPAGVRVRVHEGGLIKEYGQGGLLETRANAASFATIQAAYDALPSTKGTLVIPAGTFSPTTTPSFTGLTLSKSNVRIQGDPIDSTILELNSANKDAHFFNITTSANVLIENIKCKGPAVAATNEELGIGLRIHVTFFNLYVRNVTFQDTASWAISIVPVVNAGSMVFDNVTCFQAKKGGSLRLGDDGKPVDRVTFRLCDFKGPPYGGTMSVLSCSFNGTTTVTAGGDTFGNVNTGDLLVGTGFPGGTTVSSINLGASPDTLVASAATTFTGTANLQLWRSTVGTGFMPRAHVYLRHCTSIKFDTCAFQDTSNGAAVSFHSVCRGITFDTCHYETNQIDGDLGRHWIILALETSGVTGITWRNCTFFRNASTNRGVKLLDSHTSGGAELVFEDCFFLFSKTTDDATDDLIVGNGNVYVTMIRCKRAHASLAEKEFSVSTGVNSNNVEFIQYPRRHVNPSYTTPYTPNAKAAETIVMTLTGALTINAPTLPQRGMRLTFMIKQDGTGGRNVTWNAIYKTAWTNTGNAANLSSTITFFYDGANWWQIGPQGPWI